MNQTPGRPVLYTDGLTIGQEVSISWTCGGSDYQAYGPICKINKKSIKVTLPKEIREQSGKLLYPAGFEVHTPIPGTNFNGAWYR